MTDETGTTRRDPEIDAVRRLLADARHTEPMPADVAARMDDVLADLRRAHGRTSAPTRPESGTDPAPCVASLAAQRRRRAAGLLVAAAAIVVGGVVVAQHLPRTRRQRGDRRAGRRPRRLDSSAEDGRRRPATPDSARRGQASPRRLPAGSGRPRRSCVRRTSPATPCSRAAAVPDRVAAYAALDLPTAACVVPRPARHASLSATYERAPAVLVFHRPEGSTQVVDLFVCGSTADPAVTLRCRRDPRRS